MPAYSARTSLPAYAASKVPRSTEVVSEIGSQQSRRALLSTFDRTSLRGKRDYAMVAVLLGCGPRSAQLAAAQAQDLQKRKDHWVLADLIGRVVTSERFRSPIGRPKLSALG
jgi:hypothetical protein